MALLSILNSASKSDRVKLSLTKNIVVIIVWINDTKKYRLNSSLFILHMFWFYIFTIFGDEKHEQLSPTHLHQHAKWKPRKTFADLLMCMFIPFGKIDIYFKWKSYFCGLDAPIKVVCSIVSMMMVTFMAIDRLMVSFR